VPRTTPFAHSAAITFNHYKPSTTPPTANLPLPINTLPTAFAHFRKTLYGPSLPPPSDDPTTLRLTLQTTQAHNLVLTRLRQKYNAATTITTNSYAHVVLFHALPASQLHAIYADVTALAAPRSRFAIAAAGKDAVRVGRGVGVDVSVGAGEVRAMYEELRGKWAEWLEEEDKGPFVARYMVVDEVQDEGVIGELVEEVKRGFIGSAGQVKGLSLSTVVDGRLTLQMRLKRTFVFGNWRGTRQKVDGEDGEDGKGDETG